MDQALTQDRAADRRRRSRRPERFAFWALVMAVAAMFAGVATADAASGTVGSDGSTTTADSKSSYRDKYERIWKNRVRRRERRWARLLGECESGNRARIENDPYYGAFQFTLSTWRSAPKSPGRKPTRFRWQVQAVVSVLLKRRDGARNHWPTCHREVRRKL